MAESFAVRHERATLMGLAFAAGFVDVAGFIALFSLFTAHVTGNFVLIGAAMAGGSASGLLAKLLALPVFIIAVAFARFAILWCERHQIAPFRPVVALQVLLLSLFLLLGRAAEPVIDANAPLAVLAGMSGVAAMGFQNALARLILPAFPPTTIMTGNTTQFVIDVIDLLRGDETLRAAALSRVKRMGPVLLAFVLGTSCGALGYSNFSFLCLLGPIATLTILATLESGNKPT